MIYKYVYIYICMYVYTYVGIHVDMATHLVTPSPPTKSSGFRGFDSSRLLIIRGVNYHIHIIL